MTSHYLIYITRQDGSVFTRPKLRKSQATLKYIPFSLICKSCRLHSEREAEIASMSVAVSDAVRLLNGRPMPVVGLGTWLVSLPMSSLVFSGRF